MSWKNDTLGEIATIDWGNTNLTKRAFSSSGKFLGVSAAGVDGLIDHYEHESDTLVLSAIGANCGKLFYLDKPFTAIKNTITIKPRKDVADSKYLYYYLNNSTFRIRGAGQPFITKGDVQAKQLQLPALAIQQKIAAILDKADELRHKDQELIAKYDELLQSIFYQMFGDPVKNEKGWELLVFSEVGSLDRGVSKNRPRNAPELLGGPYPLVQTGDIANSGGYITSYKSTYSEQGLKQSKIWMKGTLCITIAANIAKTGILTFDACFPDSVVAFIPSPKTNVEFIQMWLAHLQQMLEDTAPESAQKNINLDILRKLTVPVPPFQLQEQFAEVTKNIRKQKEQVLKQQKNSESLFLSLVQKAFKGELVG
jgi:type I restriction enzyme, S subunit